MEEGKNLFPVMDEGRVGTHIEIESWMGMRYALDFL